MRDFFINWSERLLGVLIAFLALMVLLAAGAALFSPQGGILQGLAILVGGTLYVLVFGGMLYLAFGIFRNTQETNRLLAEMLRQRG